jgi:DNA invertase Pin-like site-specific DNA recombinase
MPGQNVGYIRVSSLLQNTACQLDGVPLDQVFEDQASGRDTARPELIACLRHLRAGPTCAFHGSARAQPG